MAIVLKTKGLVKSFGGLMATNNVDFELNEREIKGLIGPNGAGKTTFYNLLTGVYKPDAGKVFFKGEDITGLAPHLICRRGLVRTYQITSVFPKLTVEENVRLAAQIGFGEKVSAVRDISKFGGVSQKVEQILDLINLMDLRYQLAGELSQGDQRLLEVAIGLGSNPEVLLLDEPTAGLSARETMTLVRKIKVLFEEGFIKNIVLVEHDIEVVTGLAHAICVLNYGEVIKDGPTSEVCSDPMVQEIYLMGGKKNAGG
jgi:ABC-type branched-subunit amino acid transport system ATPase component